MDDIGLPVNFVALAAAVTVVFLLGRHSVKGTIKIFVRGAILLALVLAGLHYFSEPGALERLLDLIHQYLPPVSQG